MILKWAKYESFRNIESEEISFDPELNVIYGNNAQGKTNAIEGIYLLAQGRSHRTFHDRDYIYFGRKRAKIEIAYNDRKRENRISTEFFEGGKKRCEKNGYAVSRMSELIGSFRAVLFTPEHLSIVKDGPAKRRAFLDSAICQIDKEYLLSLQKYSRILMQRNKLLSEARFSEGALETLPMWSEQLARECEIIAAKRDEYTRRLNALVCDIFSDMTLGREKPLIEYGNRREYSQYLKMLSENTEREIKSGTTLFGVHKDDLTITVNSHEARGFASQGQQRSIALSMKLSEGEISKEESGEYPVFLFDDVLSELDEKRKEYLLHGIEGKQVIITTCDKDIKTEKGKMIYAENGKYKHI